MNSSKLSNIISEKWVSCLKPTSDAYIRLFCFPYAGAGSTVFNTWSEFLLPEIELFLVHLPGRDRRIKEEPYTLLVPLAKTIAEALYPHLDKPFAFFGHSMGALLSFEVARQLRSLFSIWPVHLIVSAKHPPQLPERSPILHLLPDGELLAESKKQYGALPEIILKDPELLQIFLPILRADLTMVETYQYVPEASLECPITVIGGLQDRLVHEKELSAWRDQTTNAFRLKMFPGDHFFIQSRRIDIVNKIKEELSRYWKT
jgi:medium-chain acyl-[acyl-carrier-protein] hydrolase